MEQRDQGDPRKRRSPQWHWPGDGKGEYLQPGGDYRKSKKTRWNPSHRYRSLTLPSLQEAATIQAQATIDGMDSLIRIVAKILVPLFFFGMVGAAVVVVISFVEDLKELLGEEE